MRVSCALVATGVAEENRVSIRRKLGMAGFCLLLGLGPLMGGFMRPEDIEELIHGTNQQKIAYVLKEGERDDAEDRLTGPTQ